MADEMETRCYPNHGPQTRQEQIVPGPCDPVVGCPPPTEIACIKVDKVYESCKHTQVNVETVDLLTIIPPAVPPITDVECVSADLVPGSQTCQILPGGRVRASFSYTYTIRFTDATGTRTFTSAPIAVEKTVVMARAGEPGLSPQCEVFLECVEAFLIDETVVQVCIGKMVLFKLFAHVQLMVPSYGFCPQPEECRVAGECPTFEPTWPPYPPQTA
ncbi:MAG: hypothetical protein D9V47_03780 [Clostridia bacterium]|nr:MAG: hypothetical protein D9V47_03780 [Clostridia bacterium]